MHVAVIDYGSCSEGSKVEYSREAKTVRWKLPSWLTATGTIQYVALPVTGSR